MTKSSAEPFGLTGKGNIHLFTGKNPIQELRSGLTVVLRIDSEHITIVFISKIEANLDRIQGAVRLPVDDLFREGEDASDTPAVRSIAAIEPRLAEEGQYEDNGVD